jgi:hypothetical protein
MNPNVYVLLETDGKIIKFIDWKLKKYLEIKKNQYIHQTGKPVQKERIKLGKWLNNHFKDKSPEEIDKMSINIMVKIAQKLL